VYGSVRIADLHIGGETAASLPLHVMGDPMYGASVPSDWRLSARTGSSASATSCPIAATSARPRPRRRPVTCRSTTRARRLRAVSRRASRSPRRSRTPSHGLARVRHRHAAEQSIHERGGLRDQRRNEQRPHHDRVQRPDADTLLYRHRHVRVHLSQLATDLPRFDERRVPERRRDAERDDLGRGRRFAF
jgi:hypothetical protein